MKQAEITIYTGQGAITYEIKATCDNFTEVLVAAIEKGIVSVETTDGSTLVINALQASAIEIRTSDIPPV